jgi:fructose/tagatose bisphosphate aldolase
MIARDVSALLLQLEGAVQVEDNRVCLLDEPRLRDKVDHLAYTAALGDGLVRDTARWTLWELGQALGIYPASIHDLYLAVGRGDLPANFTVPAMNIRAMNFNTSRAVFRAAQRYDVGALIFEIARSEMGYTDQRPAEYVACVIAAAIKEGFRGPLFIQGDHFQISAKNFTADREKEIQAVKDLISEAIAAGFYNIDIDTSTLVTLEPESLDEQQQLNYSVCAELTEYVRQEEPHGVTVSLGGEIGEVGGHNSTPEELHAFMQGYLRVLPQGVAGISKISVQTGTSHGGVVLPDGTLADVKVDFNTLAELGRVARESFGTGGAVQHGASTLPPEAFHKFPEVGTLEIHLATNFQNIIYDNAPEWFVAEAYDYIKTHHASDRKANQTEEQFLYSTRKRAIGPLKAKMWAFDADMQTQLGAVLEEQFAFLFQQLGIYNTGAMARRYATRVAIRQPRPREATAEDALELAEDLAD